MSATQQFVMSITALGILGLVATGLMFQSVPQGNLQLLSAIVGAISGAMVGGAAGYAIARHQYLPAPPEAPPAPKDPAS